MRYAMLVLKNLMRSRRRTILTIISIAVSLFIFSALVSLPTVANELLAESASSVRIAVHNKAGLTYALPESYKTRIAATPHVAAVLGESWFGGIYHEVSDAFPNLAVDPEAAEALWTDWDISRQSFADFRKIRTAALVGPGTMKQFGLHVGQQIMLRGTIYPINVTLKIVGTTGGKAPPNFLIFRRDYLEEAIGRPGFVSIYWVRADSAAAVPALIASLDEEFANSTAETQSESEAAFMNGFMENYRAFFTLAEVLGLIVVISIALVAANTAAMSIRERRAEIAVMRSLGFSSRLILSLLLAESLIIGLLGGLLGCGSAYLLLKVYSAGSPAAGPLSAIRMPPVVLAETLAVAVLIGLLSALVPARAAARQNIVDALRAVA
ncbi:MAG TPA: FtsX-like permease family protein [Candidatus Binataceae bacterium]|jgi:putative ABC transport system permease protein|nr:FtsX-like permease family protein [Candidatus Binataceae bacterium]